MDHGFTVDDIGQRLSWRAVLAMVQHTRRGSALFEVIHGESGQWSAQEHLTATLVDLTQLLLWFQTKDGQANRNRPKLTPRPGMTMPDAKSGSRQLMGPEDAISIDEWDAWWNSDVTEEVVTDGD